MTEQVVDEKIVKSKNNQFYYSLINKMLGKTENTCTDIILDNEKWPFPKKFAGGYLDGETKLVRRKHGLTKGSLFYFMLGIAGMKEQCEGKEEDQKSFENKLSDVLKNISDRLEDGEEDRKKFECKQYSCFDTAQSKLNFNENCDKCCIKYIYESLSNMRDFMRDFNHKKVNEKIYEINEKINDIKTQIDCLKIQDEKIDSFCNEGIINRICSGGKASEKAVEKICVFIKYLSLVDNANFEEIYKLSKLVSEFLDVIDSTSPKLLVETVSTRFYIFMNYARNMCINGISEDVEKEWESILENVKNIIKKIKENKSISDTFVRYYMNRLETEKNRCCIFLGKCDLNLKEERNEIDSLKNYPVFWQIFADDLGKLELSDQADYIGVYDDISSDQLLAFLSGADDELLGKESHKVNWDKICCNLVKVRPYIEIWSKDRESISEKYKKIFNKCYKTLKQEIECYRNKLIYNSKYCMYRLGDILKNESSKRLDELKEIIDLMNSIVDFYLDKDIHPGDDDYECKKWPIKESDDCQKWPIEKSDDCQKYVLTSTYMMCNRLLPKVWEHRPIVIFDVSFYMVVKNIYDYILEIIFKHDLDKSLLDEISRLKGYIDYFEKYFIDESIYEKCVIKPNEFDLLDISKLNPERELNIANEAVENICKYVEKIKGEFNSEKLEKYFLDHDSNEYFKCFENICKYAEKIRNNGKCTIEPDIFKELYDCVEDITNRSWHLIVELKKEYDEYYKEKDYNKVSQLEVYIDIFNKIYNMTSQLGAYIYYFRNYLLNYSISNIENREKINEYIENEKDTLSEKLLSIMTEGKSKKG